MHEPIGETGVGIRQALDNVAVLSLRGAIVIALSIALMALRLFQR